MTSFDLVSLFTNVPLEDKINIILRIYGKKQVLVDLPRWELHEFINLCMKNGHFTFNNKIYIQNNGVAMSSPLDPVLANIFMVELETTLISNLSSKLSSLERFYWWLYLLCAERPH